jgi:UDP-2-acetamido-2,6-beta-L-arabino-hexul-4-ose reductase
VNCGGEAELERANVRLAERLVACAERAGAVPAVVFSSSTHVDRDTPYGRSKRRAGEVLLEWAGRVGGRATVLVLPHVFGEGGRPFYNSVVSTFCHQLAGGEQPAIQADGQLELLHAQDFARIALEAVVARDSGVRRVHGEPLRVGELLDRLQAMVTSYRAMVVPPLGRALDLRLFNTYRSYLFPAQYPLPFKLHTDPRGSLFECVRSVHGGQCFVSTTKPGITRGNHFHTRKFERFAVIGGEAVIRLRRLFDDTVHEFAVRGDAPVAVDMPTLHTHSIENTGAGELTTLFWSHEFFDPADPDTFQEPVLR